MFCDIWYLLGRGGIFCYGMFVWVVIKFCRDCFGESCGNCECDGVFFGDEIFCN